MPIKPKAKSDLPETKTFEKSIKLQTPGDYICEVIDTRMNPESDRFSESYYIDFKVISGPANVGDEAHVCKYPADASGGKNKRTGQTFSKKQAREKDEIRVQQWLAACFGLSWDDAGELAEGGTLDGQFDACFTGEDPETRVRGSSPAAGNTILVRCKSNGKKGEDERFYSEVYPFTGEKPAAAPAKAAAPAATKAKPALPAKPAPKPTFEAAYEAAGYAEYPGEADYLLRMEGGEAVETVEKADIRKQLGY
jgi:hypothetical protein